jgi:hypothetical protein
MAYSTTLTSREIVFEILTDEWYARYSAGRVEAEETDKAVFVGLIDGARIDQDAHTMLSKRWIAICDFLH